MKAVVCAPKGKVKVDEIPDPQIQESTDAVVQVRRTAICGSDIHLLDGTTPGMREGAVIGHEFVGLITDLGDDVQKHFEGTRVLGSFLIACGECAECVAGRFNFCANRRALGLGTLAGDLDGAQAESIRVPNADLNLKTLDGALSGLSDEEALLAGDVMTTGFYGAALADIARDDVVAVLGGGPIGLFCALACRRAGAERVIVLDTDPKRAKFAKEVMGLESLHLKGDKPEEAVKKATGGALPDVTVDAVGSIVGFKTSLRCVRDGGRVVVLGVYGPERYEMPMGMVWIRGLDLRFAGMANVHAHWNDALLSVGKGEIDPAPAITHRLPLEEAEQGYELFRSRKALKVVLNP
ncbi:MAG: alcohol dehydrogenase catalytic domain-containing protein [Actinomycetota bacterium]|nr:alcohol dehydrogenase catalytic domain-containing protein [Actinomycetota bacterium]